VPYTPRQPYYLAVDTAQISGRFIGPIANAIHDRSGETLSSRRSTPASPRRSSER